MNEEQKFIERVRLTLDARTGSLEPHLADRLRSARSKALSTPRSVGHSIWIPALAAASLAVVVVGVMWFDTEAGKNGQVMIQANLESRATDFELLTGSEDLELYERLDFYYWLEQRGKSAG